MEYACNCLRAIVWTCDRFLCKRGTPLRHGALDYWPPLPIVVNYRKDVYLLRVMSTLLAALTHRDRVVQNGPRCDAAVVSGTDTCSPLCSRRPGDGSLEWFRVSRGPRFRHYPVSSRRPRTCSGLPATVTHSRYQLHHTKAVLKAGSALIVDLSPSFRVHTPHERKLGAESSDGSTNFGWA
ncbi:hypothetical protein H4582DRAFT_492461 [Lactarius indigo]|nr:hypothetical protein H4582DRAFT_492461 [Lactarius indigo]